MLPLGTENKRKHMPTSPLFDTTARRPLSDLIQRPLSTANLIVTSLHSFPSIAGDSSQGYSRFTPGSAVYAVQRPPPGAPCREISRCLWHRAVVLTPFLPFTRPS